jgi:hypothetical protein
MGQGIKTQSDSPKELAATGRLSAVNKVVRLYEGIYSDSYNELTDDPLPSLPRP